MKKLCTIFLMLITLGAVAQSGKLSVASMDINNRTAKINYLENYPYAYKDKNGALVGIEIDILNEFGKWLKAKKGIDAVMTYESFTNFAKFYESVKTGGNLSIGAGSVTITTDRSREVRFSSSYMKNKPLLITSINVPTLTDIRNIAKDFANKKAVVVKGSIHEKWVNEIKNNYWPALTIEYVESPAIVLNKIAGTEDYFGYVDLVTYWAALQKDSKPLKLHRLVTPPEENFAFIFPKESQWYSYFNEFFDSGLGFTSTRTYMAILRKHLGEEIVDAVAIQQY